MAFTEEQNAAVAEKGRVIVSASAGSGKTTVMIERLVRLISDGVDVRNVLAITFTKKAAAQMREKLRTALLSKLSAAPQPERERLIGQLKELPLADICTIHGFCGRLIRANFFLADTEADFRIGSAEDGEMAELSSRAMDETFERAYEENDGSFRALLAVYYRKKKDDGLRRMVRDLYAEYRKLYSYRDILAQEGKSDRFDEICAYLLEDFRRRAAACADGAAREAERLSGYPAAAKVAGEIAALAQTVAEADDLFALKEALGEKPNISRNPSKRKSSTQEELRSLERLSGYTVQMKELFSEIVEEIGEREVEYGRYLDGQRRSEALAKLVLLYDEIFTGLKRERRILEYDDLEHGALKVLADPDALRAVREKYRYVFVDEYQDVNPAQERIVDLVGGENVFLVGDKKQAIYSFRGSRSSYFTAKTAQFEHALRLSKNFRSAKCVLDVVNRVFSKAMTVDTCGENYFPDGVMTPSDRYGDFEGEVEFHRLAAKEDKEERRPRSVYSVREHVFGEQTDPQAEAVASLVEGEIGRKWFDADEGVEKTVSYRDIAVLVRDNQAGTQHIVSALSERNIPVVTSAKTDIRSFWEVRLVLDWLSLLDNAEQDIPLASAMLSSIGGFCEDDLARIRIWEREKGLGERFFRNACRRYAEGEDELALRLRAFDQKLAGYRTLCTVKSAAEMIDLLLSDGLEAEIAARKNGRLGRVRRLLREAEESVRDFLYRVDKIGYKIEYSESGGEDAVQVVTMHSSKGLEYPVVILADLDSSVVKTPKESVLFTERFSLSPKSYDLERKLSFETLAFAAAKVVKRREETEGELNLLYVAMTRAKYRLHLVFPEKTGVFDPAFPVTYCSFFDLDDFADRFLPYASEKTEPPLRPKISPASERYIREFLSVYQRKYPYENSVYLPVKSSATDLLRRSAPPDHPSRAEGITGRTSPETGTAYHAFMQFADLSSPVRSELERMKREKLLAPEQFDLLEEEKLEKIMTMPVIASLAGKHVLREQKFLLRLPADTFESPADTLGLSGSDPILSGQGQTETEHQSDPQDGIIYQGAIDLIALDGDGVLLVDYKFSVLDDRTLAEKYRLQIDLYKKAIAAIYRIREESIRAVIVNLLQCREIAM